MRKKLAVSANLKDGRRFFKFPTEQSNPSPHPLTAWQLVHVFLTHYNDRHISIANAFRQNGYMVICNGLQLTVMTSWTWTIPALLSRSAHIFNSKGPRYLNDQLLSFHLPLRDQIGAAERQASPSSYSHAYASNCRIQIQNQDQLAFNHNQSFPLISATLTRLHSRVQYSPNLDKLQDLWRRPPSINSKTHHPWVYLLDWAISTPALPFPRQRTTTLLQEPFQWSNCAYSEKKKKRKTSDGNCNTTLDRNSGRLCISTLEFQYFSGTWNTAIGCWCEEEDVVWSH